MPGLVLLNLMKDPDVYANVLVARRRGEPRSYRGTRDSGPGGLAAAAGERQGEVEAGSAAGHRIETDFTAVEFNERFGNG